MRVMVKGSAWSTVYKTGYPLEHAPISHLE
ncbi:hypothetical protein A2U01_0111434, partial [Trifolium medium]|nr:hypothetical protein [Trifolium medium]